MHERPYEQLIAWKEAHQLCLYIYCLTKNFPTEERYSLVDQMRRAASSVPTNIAEGNAKRSSKEKRRYFETSLASLDELHYQCRLAYDLKYIDDLNHLHRHIHRVSFLLTRLRSAFQSMPKKK